MVAPYRGRAPAATFQVGTLEYSRGA